MRPPFVVPAFCAAGHGESWKKGKWDLARFWQPGDRNQVYGAGDPYVQTPNAASVPTIIVPPAMMNAHDFRKKNRHRGNASELEGNVWLPAAAYRAGSRLFISRKNIGMKMNQLKKNEMQLSENTVQNTALVDSIQHLAQKLAVGSQRTLVI
jgi:hypothetical protein